ncbi:MAG TPA: serine hydrolase domain-containing protein [Gemmatimonadales bacterium]|nr:serine hydrolase domain-containing protein [Gemmatimonadales bacterium]
MSPRETTATLASSLTPIDTTAVDSLIRATVQGRGLVGLSVGIAQDGKIVFARGYGVRSLSSRSPISPQTMFAIGSVTKQFTCSALLQLAAEKKLALDDRVSKYMPNLTRAGDITLLELGQHVSGYRDYYPLDFVDREMLTARSADSIIAEYAKRPLDFEPDTRWSYSNTNFLILGRVIEKVSGQSFGAVLQQRFFTPLGMTHTRYAPLAGDSSMASGYTSFALGPPIPATPEGAGWAGSAGAIWSTPTDLLTWDLALIGGKVLNPESYRVLTTAHRLSDGRSTGYGCGDGVSDRGQAVILRHGGAVSGFVAQNTVIPATRSAVVLLANTDFAAFDEINGAIVQKLLPQIDVPVIHGPSALDAARAFLSGLREGTIDRSTLGEDFSAYLTPELLAAAQASLGKLGPITDLTVVNRAERGGMEVAVLEFKVGDVKAQALMYRTPDGKIQELLLYRR